MASYLDAQASDDRLLLEDGTSFRGRIVGAGERGATGEVVSALLERLPGRHVALNEVIDGTFPAHHPDPTVPDLERPKPGRHLAFGLGEHVCPGATLSRYEQNWAWEILLDRMNHIRPAPGKNGYEHVPGIWLRALTAILSRVPRVARDAAARTDKQVDVHIEGEGAEADKAVIEQIADVIVHLVRNSVDHGIEAPAVRRGIDKPEVGNLYVKAENRGEQLLIEIRDDGGGVIFTDGGTQRYYLPWLG